MALSPEASLVLCESSKTTPDLSFTEAPDFSSSTISGPHLDMNFVPLINPALNPGSVLVPDLNPTLSPVPEEAPGLASGNTPSPDDSQTVGPASLQIITPHSGEALGLSSNHILKVYFCAFYFIPLVYMSVLMLKPHCLDYYSFAVSFEIRKCESTNFFFFKIILAI
uniref:Uncharacterized protein n=1 Tax=Canis lupus dingo TaxID=286419 RepID=A0A8C0KDW4_CANLU